MYMLPTTTGIIRYTLQNPAKLYLERFSAVKALKTVTLQMGFIRYKIKNSQRAVTDRLNCNVTENGSVAAQAIETFKQRGNLSHVTDSYGSSRSIYLFMERF